MRFAIAFVLAACGNGASAPAEKLEMVDGPATGSIADAVKAELAATKKALVVYVGAAWCEPCEKFHRAAAAGELDDKFGNVRIVAFDFDRDEKRLEASGYRSKMLPLFVLPNADGTSSGKQIEGSIKGDAVGNLTPRLRQLLDSR